MKLRNLSQLQSALDAEIAWRIQEIADLRIAVKLSKHINKNTLIRAGIALLYAHWEGFVKAAARCYINFVDCQGMNYGDLKTCFTVIGIRGTLNEFVSANKIQVQIDALDFIRESSTKRSQLQTFTVNTESNLKSNVFENIAIAIGIDTTPYKTRYNLIDESLLSRRNKIAHGEILDIDPDAWRDLANDVINLLRQFKNDIENAACTSAFVRRNG